MFYFSLNLFFPFINLELIHLKKCFMGCPRIFNIHMCMYNLKCISNKVYNLMSRVTVFYPTEQSTDL